MHKHIKNAFKLNNPSPIMTDILNPKTQEKANEQEKEFIIKEYLLEKFEKGATQTTTNDYPKEFIPTMETIEYLAQNA